MNCSTCQTELPNGSIFCPNCGASVSAAEPIAEPGTVTASAETSDESSVGSDTIAVAASAVSTGETKTETKSSSPGVMSEFPGFFSSFFSDPFQAMHKYSHEKYWIFGLLFGLFYVLVSILFAYTNMSLAYLGIVETFRTITLRSISGFGSFLTIASLLFVFFLLQKPFGISPSKNLKQSLASTGIAFWLLGPVTLLNEILGLLSVSFGITAFLSTAVYALGALLLYEEVRASVTKFDAKKALLLIVLTIGSMPLLSSMIYTIAVRLLY